MAIREFVKNLMAHGEERPEKIDLDTAAHIVSLLIPSHVPADLTPERFMTEWNDILDNDPPDDLWS